MADVEDVLAALADLATTALYSGGTSVTGDALRIYPGWPSATQLETDLRSGVAHVNVFPMDAERNVSRYSKYEWEDSSVPDPTITVTVDGTNSFTLGGTVSPSENVAVIVNWASGGGSFVHPAVDGDTLSSIASSLASALSTGGIPASANGSEVTLTGATSLEVRVGVKGRVQREVRRQERWLQLILWANTPDQRARIGRVLDAALAAPNFISLADGSAGRMIYRGSPFIDRFQKEEAFRRDWRLTVEFGTTEMVDAYSIVVPEQNTTTC